ncbi:conserved exported hypothetical protein [Candidatus Competibacter denitrificans Run_A_D11]|uniref:Carboxypeptidase regulatory-like domain-containing protein n=1 Tax=Candidatus Competibacter denitrificans Run_A_D11 TaxID=1400863 RepID=W6M2E1_9GAMM|nr:hypothetical protein [Candidatus Competibacter denitrificans]CDI01652.1 conserved exported hypothetical protein [Candidatus Competibacter denitrificans Run_A_D11]HAS85929.1 hypothetical protein [Candidatus Competibacteraceae bacterium]HRC69175.1 carboxypeptidase regulatory-like domain-containing protein [Candidatus Competibacter denitrificans]
MAHFPRLSLIALGLAVGTALSTPVVAQQAPPPLYRSSPPVEQLAPVYLGRSQTEEVIEERTVTSGNPPPPPPPPPESEDKGWLPPGGSIQVRTTDQGIRYTSGGVGESEREELRAISDRFNLRVMSAMQGGGEYLADTAVKILDSRGEVVLSANSKGPYFLAQIPPGTYTVAVSTADHTQQQSVRIDGPRQSQLNFYWR